jgi:hypothetical protein
LPGVAAVGGEPVAGLGGDQGWRHDPTIVLFGGESAGEPRAAGTSRIDDAERLGFGWHLRAHLIDVTLAGAEAAAVGDLGAVILRDVGHGNRVLVARPAEKEDARRGHG